MLDFSIAHVGVYRHAETFVQTVSGTWLTLYVSGLKYCRTYLPDGRLIREDDARTTPYFALKLPGMKIDFEHSFDRENWVVMLEAFPLRYSRDGSGLEINCGVWIKVPFFTELPRERLPGWLVEMKKIQDAFRYPTPLNTCKARLGVMNILRFIVEGEMESLGVSPEERLKQLIDEDVSFSRCISSMSASCNVSPDHLRRLFYERYQINPQTYRLQKRNALIMEMIATSSLSIKEISARAGFKHVPHFCIEFRRQFGMTPKEGIRRFRYLRA